MVCVLCLSIDLSEFNVHFTYILRTYIFCQQTFFSFRDNMYKKRLHRLLSNVLFGGNHLVSWQDIQMNPRTYFIVFFIICKGEKRLLFWGRG